MKEKPMKEELRIRFIFFSTQKGQRYEEILEFAKELFLPAEISTPSSVEGFSKAVVEPGFDHRIILILLGSSKDLAQISPCRDLLENRPVVLILPNSEKKTMIRALSLYPRYIDYIQNNLKDVYLVLKKMVQKLRGRTDGEKSPTHNSIRRKQK